MRRIACLLLSLVAVPLTVHGDSALLEIDASRSTVERHRGAEQDVPRGTTRYTEQDIVYTFSVKPRSTRVPDEVLVEWAVLVEKPGGRIETVERGGKVLNVRLGRASTVAAEAVTLQGREYDMRRGSGDVKDDVYGYGVRVLDADGNVLAEKYSRTGAQDTIDWSVTATPRADDREGRAPHRRPRPRDR